MASRVIDTFCVRHSGPQFLHPWRYRQVLIDENGNLSSRTKPGKPGLDDPCISDYGHKDRRYKNNQLITEFCNTVTHTNYRVYAQDCPPYAYVQTDLNASKCGYLTPLPEPSVPPNPFGEGPPYGEYYYFDYCDIDGVAVSVKIFKKSYSGVPIQVEEGGKSPVVLKYTNSDNDNKFGQIRSCEAIITFNALTDFQYQKFYTDDEREYLVEVRKDSELKFSGYVIPDTAQEPFIAPPYPITVRATDGIGALKNVTYPIPIGSDINIKQTFLDIICFCLAMTNLNLNIRTTCNLYEIGMDNEIDKDPLALAYVSPLRMSDDKGNIYTAYDALIAVLTLFTARLYQENGMWNFERIGDLSGNTIRSRIYNHTGFFLYSEEIDPHRIAGKDEDIELINHGHSLRIGNAYKRVETLLKFGESPAIIFNGKFDQWDGQNFNYWTKYGGVSIDRTQKTITGYNGGIISINDYALKFNESANSGKWLESNPIAVIKGSKVGLTLDISASFARLFKIRIKIGQYYLFNEPYTNNYQWVTSLSTVSVQLLFNGLYQQVSSTINSDSFNNYTINIPEVPETGYMTIQLFGVETIGYNNPSYVDNIGISISQSTNDGKNEKDGYLNISEQSGFYTNSPEQIELIYGDYVQSFSIVGANLDLSSSDVIFNNTVFGITTTGSTAFDNLVKTGTIQSTLNTLYAIYTGSLGSSLSTLWYEYGQSAEKLPIALWCAKSILKAYQKPFRYMEGDYKGTNLKYSDLISFNVPNNTPFSNRIFMIMDGEFDLKYNTLTGCSIVEIFNKNIKTSDISTPHSPGDISPPIVQNPNNPSPDTINGIFTEEFTPEFL